MLLVGTTGTMQELIIVTLALRAVELGLWSPIDLWRSSVRWLPWV